MDSANAAEPINILLSQEEVRFVLRALGAKVMNGLDNEPFDALSAEQQAVALAVASRALQARRLVTVRDGSWVIHKRLLTALGACVYSQRALFVYHWRAESETPARYFGHVRSDDVVAHTQPQESLHLFTLLSSTEQLAKQIQTLCGYVDASSDQSFDLTMTGQDFVRVRELAAANATQEAISLLVKYKTPDDTAQAFVATLAAAPHLTIVQALVTGENGAVQTRECTLVHQGQRAWLLSPTVTANRHDLLHAQTTTTTAFQQLLSGWLQGTGDSLSGTINGV